MSSKVTGAPAPSFYNLDDGFEVQTTRRGRRESKAAATHLSKVSHIRAKAYARPASAPAPRAAPAPSFSLRGPSGVSATSRAILVPGADQVAAAPRTAVAAPRAVPKSITPPPRRLPAAAPAAPRPNTAPASTVLFGPDGGEIRRVDEVAIRNFKFSQPSIGASTSTGMTLEELQEAIDKKGWDEREPPLQAMENEDGSITVLDNRRTYTLKKILEGNPSKKLNIPVEVFKRFSPIDRAMMKRLTSYGRSIRDPQIKQWRAEIKKRLVGEGLVRLRTMSEGVSLRMFAEAPDPTTLHQKDLCGFTDLPKVRGHESSGRRSPSTFVSPRPLRGRAMEAANWRE